MKPSMIHVANLTINMHAPQASNDSADPILGHIIRHSFAAGIADRLKAKTTTARFELACDGAAVIDHQTGLMWTADTVATDKKWADAKAAASSVSIGGHSDWRLPEQSELLSIVDYGRYDPAINTDVFKCDSRSYWSNTPYANPSYSGYAWLVNFVNGGTGFGSHNGEARVRAVRSVSSSASQ